MSGVTQSWLLHFTQLFPTFASHDAQDLLVTQLEHNMRQSQIEITLSKDKLGQVVRAYQFLTDFLDETLPRDLLYQTRFRRGLGSALREVKSGKSQKVRSFDEFVKQA